MHRPVRSLPGGATLGLLFALGSLVALGGCVGAATEETAFVAESEGTVRTALRRLARSEVAVSGEERVRQVRFVAEGLAQVGLMPAAGGSFFRPHPGAARTDSAQVHVLGHLPGRQAGARNDLVVVAADLEGPAAAALLGAAQQLARRAVFENVPPTTVLVAFWAPPRTGALGFADFAALPGWLPSQIRRVLYVSADTTLAPVRAALAPLGDVPVAAVPPPTDAREGTSTLAAMLRARETEATLRWAARLTDAILAATPD